MVSYRWWLCNRVLEFSFDKNGDDNTAATRTTTTDNNQNDNDGDN